MPVPIKPFAPDNVHTEAISAVSVASIGVKLNYVVPANHVSKLVFAGYILDAGAAAVIALQMIVEEGTITLASLAAAGVFTGTIWLDAGDTIQWNVTTLGAAGTADLVLVLEDYEIQ